MPPKSKPTQKQSSLLSFFGKQTTSVQKEKVVKEEEVINKEQAVKDEEPAETTTESLQVVSGMDLDETEIHIPPPSPPTGGRRQKRFSYKESGSESDDPTPVRNPFAAKKRRLKRRITESDEEDDYKPETEVQEDEFDDGIDDSVLGSFMTEVESTQTVAPPLTPMMERFKRITVEPSSPSKAASTSVSNKLSSSLTSKQVQRQERDTKFKEKNTDRYHWLVEQKDSQGNPIDSPEYDPRTLYIPASAWKKFTPFEKQYWEIKHKFWDTIVFFKKGKFYELYERDADIGHKDFDLKMTDRVNMRMVGVPEMSFDYWTAQFIAKGHKVAKVDQMETAIGKSMREKGDTKSKEDKIIRRELTCVLTAGTLVDSGLLTNDLGTYCMSIKELCGDENSPPTFGICFVDTSTAEFNFVHFQDDVNRTKFETLIMQIKPKELVTEKGRLSKTTTRLLKSLLNEPLWNMLIPDTEFWDSRLTQDELDCNSYWSEEDEKNIELLSAAMTVARSDPVLMSAFGALIWYLRSLKLDTELLSAKNIMLYDPIKNATSLVLDGQTLINLEIFQNSYDKSTNGTVYKLLANSITPFGKRLFKQWLCHPLRRIEDITNRQDAIEDLMGKEDFHMNIARQLTSLPDLERMISRIHSGRIQVKEFLGALHGFEIACNMMNTMADNRSLYKSKLLLHLIDVFPRIEDRLDTLKNTFELAEVDVDYQKAKTMIPVEGQDSDWDSINEQIQNVEAEFTKHLKDVQKELKNARVCYKDIGKDIYQIEVPKAVKVPSSWIKMSNTNAVNRYYDQTVKSLVTEFKELKETKNAFVKKFSLKLYEAFDKSFPLWLSAVKIISEIDALMGLAKGSMQLGAPACRPTFVDGEKGVIEFEELRHPCVVPGAATDFIPNDVALGGEKPSMIVLTGPNMGGKSTLLRQTCVAVIMAQLGGYVPAKSCTMTACDRIYTRIGADDNIMRGQSTFMVELAETSKVLREATNKSMVILDELGRGTSTFDGYSIAYSVLHYISTHIGCLGMFATHYQALCKEFDRNPEINNMHMGYIMDDDRDVTFLHKLTPGICEKSFGMNVARMAGIPSEIVKRATEVAKEFEISHKKKDTTYSMEVDGEASLTPAIAADVKYLFSSASKDSAVTQRILKSFRNLKM